MTRSSTDPIYNIHVVIQETGVKEDTLRAWERRYGLPKPSRSEGGHRLFSDLDIETIKWLQLRLEEGMRIGQAVKLWTQREKNAGQAVLAPRGAESGQIGELRERWIEACMRFDDRAGDEITRRAFAIQPAPQVCDQIFREGLVRIGDLWYQNLATVQQEHFAAEAAARHLHALINAAPAPWRGKTILIGAPAGERHVLPNLLLTFLLRDQGYEVFNLGADVPLENIEITIQSLRLDMIISSVARVNSLLELKALAEAAIDNKIRFAFGGRVFVQYPELVAKIPGAYLGNSFDQALGNVEQCLKDLLDASTAKREPHGSQVLGRAFAANQKRIALKALQGISGASNDVLSDARWDTITNSFNQVLLTAIVLDDQRLVSSELIWARDLIGPRGFSAQLFKDLVEAYSRAIEEILGSAGNTLRQTLSEIVSELDE